MYGLSMTYGRYFAGIALSSAMVCTSFVFVFNGDFRLVGERFLGDVFLGLRFTGLSLPPDTPIFFGLLLRRWLI